MAANNHSHKSSVKPELGLSILCGVFLASGFLLSTFTEAHSAFILTFYIAAYLTGGYFTTREAIDGIKHGHFEIDFLMLVAALGAAALGEWAEGALLLFLFSLGHALEHFAMEKARRSITALAGLAPKTALLKKGDTLTEVDISTLIVGNVVLVKPNTKIPADGYVIAGRSAVNQAPITGESIPIDKSPVAESGISENEKDKERHRVFAGTINGNGTLEIKVTKPASDSTIARLIKLVNEAQSQKSSTQLFADRIEKYYVPAVLVLVTLLLFAFVLIDESFSESFYRAMSVLVAASPCALAISTPSAVLSGISRAGRAGVLIKGGKPLEELGSLSAIAFDKTGTLTQGRPVLTGVYPLNGITEDELLRIVIAVEKLSDHPLAAALVKGGLARLNEDVLPARNARSVVGRGVVAEYQNNIIYIGNPAMFTERNMHLPVEISLKIKQLESEGNTTMVVQREHTFIGLVTLMDVEREEAASMIERLKKIGIKKIVMLTGDDQKVAEAVAKKLGVTEVWGNLLPEDKVAAIDKLIKTNRKIAMVGDGVNDAPAMARSTVSIAMGAAGSDVALETADIALMADKLSNLPFAIGLSRKAHRIIRQNIFISIGMVVILIPLTITGNLSMGPAVIGHEGSTIVVVFNALRLLAFKNNTQA